MIGYCGWCIPAGLQCYVWRVQHLHIGWLLLALQDNRRFFENITVLSCFIAIPCNALWCYSLWSWFISVLSVLSIRSLTGLLNSIVLELGNPSLTGMGVISKQARFILQLISIHLFIVYFMNSMHASAWP